MRSEFLEVEIWKHERVKCYQKSKFDKAEYFILYPESGMYRSQNYKLMTNPICFYPNWALNFSFFGYILHFGLQPCCLRFLIYVILSFQFIEIYHLWWSIMDVIGACCTWNIIWKPCWKKYLTSSNWCSIPWEDCVGNVLPPAFSSWKHLSNHYLLSLYILTTTRGGRCSVFLTMQCFNDAMFSNF